MNKNYILKLYEKTIKITNYSDIYNYLASKKENTEKQIGQLNVKLLIIKKKKKNCF